MSHGARGPTRGQQGCSVTGHSKGGKRPPVGSLFGAATCFHCPILSASRPCRVQHWQRGANPCAHPAKQSAAVLKGPARITEALSPNKQEAGSPLVMPGFGDMTQLAHGRFSRPLCRFVCSLLHDPTHSQLHLMARGLNRLLPARRAAPPCLIKGCWLAILPSIFPSIFVTRWPVPLYWTDQSCHRYNFGALTRCWEDVCARFLGQSEGTPGHNSCFRCRRGKHAWEGMGEGPPRASCWHVPKPCFAGGCCCLGPLRARRWGRPRRSGCHRWGWERRGPRQR